MSDDARILNAHADLLMRADLLAEAVADTLGIDRPAHVTSAYDNAIHYLQFVNAHLHEFTDEEPA